MHKPRTFFYVCAGLLLFGSSLRVGPRSAGAQAGIVQTAAVVTPRRAPRPTARRDSASAIRLPPHLAENLPPELSRSWARVLTRILARAADSDVKADLAKQEKDLTLLLKYKIVMGFGTQGSPPCWMVGKGFYSLTYPQREFVAMQVNDYQKAFDLSTHDPSEVMPSGRWRRDEPVVFDLCDGYSGVRLYRWDGERMISP